jgi:tetratricopeptide (TPR) repeat protein
MAFPFSQLTRLTIATLTIATFAASIVPAIAQTPEAIQQSQQRFKRGQQLYQRGELEAAAQAFQQAQQLHPTFDHAYYLGVTYLNALQNDRAIPAFEAAIALDPAHESVGWAYSHIGKAHLNLKQYDAAIVAYQQATNRLPQTATIVENLGIAYHLNGQYSEAIQAYEQALRLNPANPDIRQVLEKARTRQKP